MKYGFLTANLLMINACTPAQPHSSPEPSRVDQAQALGVSSPAPLQPNMATTLHRISHGDINFNVISFDDRDHQLEVADQPNGPGTVWPTAKAAAKQKNALAALNAGFFTPEGKPLGLVIENGAKRGVYNASSLGNGIYYSNDSETKILRNHDWRNILKTNPTQLLQSGPMLVENGNSTKGLSTQNSRPRSFIATDNNHHWIMGHASSCTLSQLGKALDHLKIDGFSVYFALNLDGGRSSDLWVSAEIANGPFTIRPFWNKPVRNFLVLKRK